MRKVYYLLFVIMLLLPCLRANATYDSSTHTMTYEINRSGGQVAGSYKGNWSGNETSQWQDAKTVVITCKDNCYLNSDDAAVLKTLATNYNLENLDLSGAKFQNSVLSDNMFSGCTKLKTVKLPTNTTSIGAYCFSGCTALTTVEIKSPNCTSINDHAFAGCTSFDTFVFYASLNILSGDAFADNAKKPTKVYIYSTGDGSIASTAQLFGSDFYNVVNTLEIHGNIDYLDIRRIRQMAGGYYEGVSGWLNNDGTDTGGTAGNLNILNLQYSIIKDEDDNDGNWCYHCSDEWNFGGGLGGHYCYSKTNSIGTYLFAYCSKLTAVYLAPQITSIGIGCFRNCDNLSVMFYSSSLAKIDWQAFEECKKLEYLYRYDNGTYVPFDEKDENPVVTEINSQAFQDCELLRNESLKQFTNVQTIGYYAFKNCKLLQQDVFEQLMKTMKYGNDDSGNGDYSRIPEGAFAGCPLITNINLASNNYIHGIGKTAFQNCTGITSVTINSAFYSMNNTHTVNNGAENVVGIDKLAFDGDKNISSITFMCDGDNHNTAPSCPKTNTLDDGTLVNPFNGIDPQKCTLIFGSDADVTQREANFDGTSASNGNETNYRSFYYYEPYKTLLTKTLDENATSYDVVPQMHAIVKLLRSFKGDNWNTLVLPFGSPNYGNNEYSGTGTTDVPGDCALLFKNALDVNNADGFKIAVYRGLKNNSVFTYLNYNDYFDNGSLYAFQPILVYIPASDVTTTYTFTDVNLNYDNGFNQYTADKVKPSDFNGWAAEWNNSNIPCFYHLNVSDFLFTGTFKTISGTGILGDNDYFLQNSTYYKGDSQKSYGFKGFRGWFKYRGNGGAKEQYGVDVDDQEGNSLTGIMNISDDGEVDACGNIYNLNGQLVRANATSTSGLPMGAYIFNRKIVLVK
jgi:hypothetical protein